MSAMPPASQQTNALRKPTGSLEATNEPGVPRTTTPHVAQSPHLVERFITTFGHHPIERFLAPLAVATSSAIFLHIRFPFNPVVVFAFVALGTPIVEALSEEPQTNPSTLPRIIAKKDNNNRNPNSIEQLSSQKLSSPSRWV